MPTPAELAVSHTELEPEALEHLQRLMGSWSVLSDLSFSDLLLLVPVAGLLARGATEDPELVVMGQMRPNNRPTLVEQDLVGQTVNESQWDLVAKCLHTGEIVRGNIHHPIIGERVPVENIPVRFEGAVIAVMLRVSLAPLKGPTSTYERTYLDVFERLADMVAQSAFPFPDEDVGTEEAPRVGDGVVVVDADGRVEFASPNAMNAFHRMGIYSPPEGRRFGDLDIDESAVEWALTAARPVVEEVERRPDVIVLVHCIPLLSHDVVTGAMILLRDVTDVRRLDRLLLSKDAAIREVHHRVKNNLQTISSLLSLQARRVDDRAARIALREAERRVRSIALVHEILSRDPTEQVPFAEIVVSLVQMAEDSVVSAQPIVISTSGDLGDVTADVATPLAVTVAELLQNAVEHGFEPQAADDGPGGADGTGPVRDGASTRVGHVVVTMANTGTELTVAVQDDGVGLPEGFDFERSTSLGLSIVRDLVESQLEGDIGMVSLPESEGGGTRVLISVPVRAPR
jgi:two-component system, sensor histidine kinase PdtaS